MELGYKATKQNAGKGERGMAIVLKGVSGQAVAGEISWILTLDIELLRREDEPSGDLHASLAVFRCSRI